MILIDMYPYVASVRFDVKSIFISGTQKYQALIKAYLNNFKDWVQSIHLYFTAISCLISDYLLEILPIERNLFFTVRNNYRSQFLLTLVIAVVCAQ